MGAPGQHARAADADAAIAAAAQPCSRRAPLLPALAPPALKTSSPLAPAAPLEAVNSPVLRARAPLMCVVPRLARQWALYI